MLIALTETRGRTVWINPIYVKAIVEKSPGVCHLYGSFGMANVLKMQGSAIDLATRISAAMPDAGELAAVLAAEQEQAEADDSASAAVAMG